MVYTSQMKKTFVASFLISAFFCGFFFTGCNLKSQKTDTFVIWTDRKEFVSYTELFNSIQDKTKAIIVYKDRLALQKKTKKNPI